MSKYHESGFIGGLTKYSESWSCQSCNEHSYDILPLSSLCRWLLHIRKNFKPIGGTCHGNLLDESRSSKIATWAWWSLFIPCFLIDESRTYHSYVFTHLSSARSSCLCQLKARPLRGHLQASWKSSSTVAAGVANHWDRSWRCSPRAVAQKRQPAWGPSLPDFLIMFPNLSNGFWDVEGTPSLSLENTTGDMHLSTHATTRFLAFLKSHSNK